jgi:hypothetical protein
VHGLCVGQLPLLQKKGDDSSGHTHMTHLGISVAHSRQKACLQGTSRPWTAIGT